MFKAEELGERNRNCWYSTSESKGREWDLVFLISIFSLKCYGLDISAHTFLAEEFQGLEESREETISNQCFCAFGTGLSLQPWVSFWRLSLLRHSLISFPEAAILLVSDGADQKDRGPLGTRLVAVPPKVYSWAQKQFRQENYDDKSFTGLLSRREVIGIQGNLTFVFNVLGIH